jgi:hypothetical protein
MTQVLSVSANTAAYVSEAMKPPGRTPRTTDVEVAIDELARKAGQSDDVRLKAILNVVRPPALQIYFLTASQYDNPKATLAEAQAAYDQQQQAAMLKAAEK